jgi:hypothetical protein
MALKFDGKYLKDGSKTLCYVQGNYIKGGFHNGPTLCTVQGNYIKGGFHNGPTLCHVQGNYIKEGFHNGKTLIKTSDAARKIGATSQSPMTAAMWYLFCSGLPKKMAVE